VPILIINGEGYRDVLDLFISIAFDFYYDKMNHGATFQLEPEEQKVNNLTGKKHSDSLAT
jgi:hypothetical protein